MSRYQPSLWDNVALENGYKALSDFNLKEAVVQFKEALLSADGNRDSIQTTIDTCLYWQKLLNSTTEVSATGSLSEYDNQFVSKVLKAYIKYPFDSRMTGLKKKILGHLARIFQEKFALDLNTFETIFDLLLDLKLYPDSENLASHYVRQLPKEYFLLYFLAQAQWFNKNKSQACGNYASALLYYPDPRLKNRIMHEQLQKIVRTYGMEMAPVFGRFHEILPFVPIGDDVHPLNLIHQNALQSYPLVQKLLNSGSRHDKANIHYRMQLKEQAPILFEAFMHRLKRRE